MNQSNQFYYSSVPSDNDTIGIGGTDIADGVVNGAVIAVINKVKIQRIVSVDISSPVVIIFI